MLSKHSIFNTVQREGLVQGFCCCGDQSHTYATVQTWKVKKKKGRTQVGRPTVCKWHPDGACVCMDGSSTTASAAGAHFCPCPEVPEVEVERTH